MVLPLLRRHLRRLLDTADPFPKTLLRVALQPIPRPDLLRALSHPRPHPLDPRRQTLRRYWLVQRIS
jgi:hypothetical protein